MKHTHTILTAFLVVAVLAAAPAFAQTRCPDAVTCRGAQRIFPSSGATNSFQVTNTSGTSMFKITAAGAITFGGAQTFSAAVTFDSTVTWGTAGTINFDGTTIDLDPTDTFDLEMAAGKVASIDMSNNLTSAFSVMEAAVPYIVVNTNTGTESIVFGGTADDPSYSFAGTGTLSLAGGFDGAGIGDFADTLTCSKGSGVALDIDSGGELNVDGTLDQNGNADLAGDVVFSGSSKTISFASAIDANAGADIGGAALNLSYAGDALTMGATNDASLDGYVAHGTGTPDKLAAGTAAALYVTDAFEVDGLAYFDAATICADAFEVDGLTTLDGGYDSVGPITESGVTTYTTTQSLLTTSHVVYLNPAAGAFTFTLTTAACDAAGDVGRVVELKCINSGANGCGAKNVTIATQASEKIDDADTYVLNADYEAITVRCRAADNWNVF